MELDLRGVWMPTTALLDYPIEPQAGDRISIPLRGKPMELKDGMQLRVVEVMRRGLPTPGMGKSLSIYVREV